MTTNTVKKRRIPNYEPTPTIQFPYKSKVKINSSKNNPDITELYTDEILKDNSFENNYIPDKRLKPLKKYYRPHFSPKFNSWMIDLVYYKQNQKPIYLFILNINTRYLIVYEAKDKSADEIYRLLKLFLEQYNPQKFPINIKGDGERGFLPLIRYFRVLEKKYPIEFYFKKSKEQSYQLTNSYNPIDSVIKTIRNLIGVASNNNPQAFANPDLIQKVVEIYNNTVHSAYKNKYTPAEVQDNRELENYYIKHCQQQVEKIDKLRAKEGYLNYEKDNILLVHIPIEKTPYGFSDKRRRNFDELAKFVKYEGGNAVVDLLHPYQLFSRVIIPIFYTEYIAKDLNDYINKYKDLFIIDKK